MFCEWLDRQLLLVKATDFTMEVLDSEIAITVSKKDSSPKDQKAMALMPDKFGGPQLNGPDSKLSSRPT